MNRVRAYLPVLLALAACHGTPAAEELRSEITQVGDTMVILTRGEPVPVRLDTVVVFWQSSELENPQALLAMGDQLIVGDPTRLHILSSTGERVRSVGQEGAGPGEFGSIAGLGALSADSIAVYDVRHQRISFFSAEGEHLGTARITPTPPYVNPDGSELALLRGGVISLWRENVHSDRPTRAALLWRDLVADTVAVLTWWDGERYVDYGGRMFGPSQLFGPRALAAIASDGRVAAGDGLSYCVHIRSFVDDTFQRTCRVRKPVMVGESVRNPDLSRIEDERRREALENVVRQQQIGDHLPTFDRLLFDAEGRLWVRTLGREMADVHPYLRRDAPEHEPSHRTWDVFDTDGHLLGAVDVPANFEPQAIASGRIAGFLEMPSGEIAIGTVPVPEFQGTGRDGE